ncbi:hypothetical protein F4777DRAFT_583484 [Nemania sp. FL0916]|nr:hypothetical protein F4777DRAFT_583484 [Nemania sp. FL0916]
MASSAQHSTPPLELFLIWSVQEGNRLPHWMLMTVPRLTEAQRMGRERVTVKGTRYHSNGGPTERVPCRVAVQANTNFRSESVRNREYLCDIAASDADKLARLANSIPAHQCQKYVVCMLASMERQDIIPHGIAENLAHRVRMSQRALDFESTQPAPDPVGIQLPYSWPTATPTSALPSWRL